VPALPVQHLALAAVAADPTGSACQHRGVGAIKNGTAWHHFSALSRCDDARKWRGVTHRGDRVTVVCAPFEAVPSSEITSSRRLVLSTASTS
jgi:hypothetical protein